MNTDSVPISVEYHISTTSDWTELKIIKGGWWSDRKVNCLKGCDRLRQGIVFDDKTIAISKALNDTALVEVKARCTLNIDRKYIDSHISYSITKGDLKSTIIRIVVDGKEIHRTENSLNISENPRNPMAFNVPTNLHVSTVRKRKKRTVRISSGEYDELETRAKNFRKYDRIVNFLTKYWLFAFVIAVTPSIVAENLFGREFESWEFPVFLGITVAVWLLCTFMLVKRGRKYRLEDDEWATFYTYSILNNLKKYSTTKNIEMKKHYRKKTVEDAKDFLSCINEKWKIGNFKLAQDYFGKPLSELKKNIKYRVIPSLKDEDDKSLDKVEQIMRNFLAQSRKFDLESLNTINEQMSSRLEDAEGTNGIGLRDQLTNLFSAHKILKHGSFTITLGTACCIFYYMVVSYLGIQVEYAFTGSVAIFLGLLTIYFSKQPRE